MPTFVEYNDWQLTVFDPQGRRAYAEIAAAVFSNGALAFGDTAWQQARSQPQSFNNRYLANLNAEPISGDMGAARNHADLIYHHLRSLQLPAEQPVVVGIPGYFSNEQLGILMGICQEAGVQVSGFIETALAHTLSCVQIPAAAAALRAGTFQVLDMEQHRLSLSPVELSELTLRSGQARTADGLGLLSVIDGWMNIIADEFVQKTRFDPTHSGATEQQMLDQVYSWFNGGGIQPRVSIEHNGTLRQIEVSEKDLSDKLGQRLAGLELPAGQTLALTCRAQAVPGLEAYLRDQADSVILLDRDAPAQSYQTLAQQINEGQVARIQSTVVVAPEPPAYNQAPAPSRAAAADTAAATHLMHNHTAVALSDSRFAALADQVLQPGASIEVDGVVYTAIRVC